MVCGEKAFSLSFSLLINLQKLTIKSIMARLALLIFKIVTEVLLSCSLKLLV